MFDMLETCGEGKHVEKQAHLGVVLSALSAQKKKISSTGPQSGREAKVDDSSMRCLQVQFKS